MEHLQEIWPNWTIEEKIGEGAYGKVYKIRREEEGYVSFAALKIIEFPQNKSEINELLNSGMDYLSIKEYYEDLKKNLINEIMIMESLKTAGNTVSIEDYCFKSHEDNIGWTIYIRMELLESLNDYQQRTGEMSEKELIKLGSDICLALKCCEQAHVIHRDIKPDNVFRNQYGDYKLGDFGISKQLEMTKSAYSQKGTSMYMAPEVFRGEHYDHTVDIYSLGIMLYRLANHGRFPFMPPVPERIRPSDAETAMQRRMNGEIFPPLRGVNANLASTIKKACAYRAMDRYQKALDFREDLLGMKDTVSRESDKKQETEYHPFEEDNRFEKTYSAWTDRTWGDKEKKESQQWENVEKRAEHFSEGNKDDARPQWMKPNDMVQDLALTELEALTGCDKVVYVGSDEHLVITVPAGIKEGQFIRIRRKRDEKSLNAIIGDLYLHINITKQESKEEKTSESTEKLWKYVELCSRREDLISSERWYLEKIAEQEPQNTKAWTMLGNIYEKLELWKAAEESYLKAVMFDKGNCFLWITLGNVYEKQQDYKNACMAYNEGVKLIKRENWKEGAAELEAYKIILPKYAVAAEKAGDKGKALELVREAEKAGCENIQSLKQQIKASDNYKGFWNKWKSKK